MVDTEVEAGATEAGGVYACIKSLSEVGLDPHGRTPLWHFGLGSLEGHADMKRLGIRDHISILSNIAERLYLEQHLAIELLYLYKRFCKSENDSVHSALVACFYLVEREENLKRKLAIKYCSSNNNNNSDSNSSNSSNSNNKSRVRSRNRSSNGNCNGNSIFRVVEEIVISCFNLNLKAKNRYAYLIEALRTVTSLKRLWDMAERYGAKKALNALLVWQVIPSRRR